MQDEHAVADASRVLVAACHPVRERGIAALAAPAPEVEWPYFLHLAISHRVVGILAERAEAAHENERIFGRDGLMPGEYRRMYLYFLEANPVNNAILAEASCESTSALNAAGIPVAVRKGIPLAIATGSTALRVISDVDLIVSRSQRREAADVLGELAVERLVPSLQHRDRHLLALTPVVDEFTVTPRGKTMTLQLSIDIAPRSLGFRFDVDAALASVVSVRSEGGVIPTFDDAHLFLDVAAGIYEDAKSITAIMWGKDLSLAKLVDLGRLWLSFSVDLRQVVIDMATQYQMTDVLYFGFRCLRELWPDITSELVDVSPSSPELWARFGETERQVHLWPDHSFIDRMFVLPRAKIARGIQSDSLLAGLPDRRVAT